MFCQCPDLWFGVNGQVVWLNAKRNIVNQKPLDKRLVGTHLNCLVCCALLGQVCWERYVLPPCCPTPH